VAIAEMVVNTIFVEGGVFSSELAK